MRMPSPVGVVALATCAGVGVLMPVRFSLGSAVYPAVAECTTCCPRPGSLCVVCGKKCVTIDAAYDNGSGPCPL
jgi:hypothetical protein